jgi:hypothetical protein
VSPDSAVYLGGTLDNSNAVLHLASYGGSWYCSSGNVNYPLIAGGTLDESGTNLLVQTGTFSGVTITGGDLHIAGTVRIQNGLTIANHNIDLASSSNLYVLDASIDNVNIRPSGTVAIYGGSGSLPSALTLGTNVTVHDGAEFLDQYYNETLTNNGVISADGRTGLWIDVTRFVNNAVAEASNSGRLNIGVGSLVNNGTISASGGSTIALSDSFTLGNLGRLNASSDSFVEIFGTLNNIGTTLNPANYGGYWLLGAGSPGATISGGSIDNTSNTFRIWDGTLDGVTVLGSQLGVSGNVTFKNSFSANLTLNVGSGSILTFVGACQTMDNLNIVAAGPSTVYAGGSAAAQTLTLGRNVTVHHGITFANQNAGDTLVNNGTINADTGSLQISTDNFTNNSLAEATSGGSLYIASRNFSNHGTLAMHNGRIYCSQSLSVGNGTLTGSGTVAEALVLSSASDLSFDLAGETQGSLYDSIAVTGNTTLGGMLQLSLTNAFVPQSSDIFTLLTVGNSFKLSGAFGNVPDGGRLVTTDGEGSFLVNYGSGSYASEIVVSDYQTVPEPATGMVIGVLAVGHFWRRRTPKARPVCERW